MRFNKGSKVEDKRELALTIRSRYLKGKSLAYNGGIYKQDLINWGHILSQ